MGLFRPRLVVPVEYASRWQGQGPIDVSPSGRLAFIDLVVDEEGIDRVLEEMTEASADWLRRHPDAPSILDVCRYQREPKGENDYLHLAVSLGEYADEYESYTDCEDLEIGVSAEQRVRHHNPRARPVKERQTRSMWHIVTDLGNGRRQDSSRILIRRHETKWIP